MRSIWYFMRQEQFKKLGYYNVWMRERLAMILTDKEIRALCISDKKKSEGLITPFSEDALQSESYDLAIGNRIAVLKKEICCIDVTNQNEINEIYDEHELPISGYVLSPKEYVLVSLRENIALPDNITAHIRPRTRFTRLGLIVSDQHCNSTYEGNLKIGLYNATGYAIKIFRGVRVAQIVFEELKSKPSSEKLYKNKDNAVYQNEQEFIGAVASTDFEEKVADAVKLLLKREE